MATNYTFDNLQNDNVKFLQGTQANLELLMPSSTDATKRGTAIEGAFYLTTDTHRLYIGRKVTTGDDANLVFPVQVSAGITTVADAGALQQISTVGAEEGDFYYIENTNVLAVLRIDNNGTKQWVQVNPPTGIESFKTDATQSSTSVLVQNFITTAADNDPPTADLYLDAGRNVTLTATQASEIIDSQTNKPVTLAHVRIDSADYDLGTTATPATTGGTAPNGAVVKLDRTVGGSTGTTATDSSVTILGATNSLSSITAADNTITAVSDSLGNITLNGPRFDSLEGRNLALNYVETTDAVDATNYTDYFIKSGNTYITPTSFNSAVTYYEKQGGFGLKLNYYNPQSGGLVSTDEGYIDPIITVGSTSNTFESSHFNNGIASLNVYTKEEVDRAIAASTVTAKAAANAMTYKGTFSTVNGLLNSFSTISGSTRISTSARVGDTYKAVITSDDPTTAYVTLNGEKIYNGDLVILRGTPGFSPVAANIVNASNVTSYYILVNGDYVQATTYDANTTYYEGGIIPYGSISYDIIPSGDEPLLHIREGIAWPDNGFGIAYNTVSSGTVNSFNVSSYYIKDGDEYIPASSYNAGTTYYSREVTSAQQTSRVILADSKDGGFGDILSLSFTGNKYINIGSIYNSNNHQFDLTFLHGNTSARIINDWSTVTEGDVVNKALTTANVLADDGLGQGTYSLFLFSNPTDIKMDQKGHLIGVEGKQVVFRHNRLTSFTHDYTIGTRSGASLGQINNYLEDSIGVQTNSQIALTSSTLVFSEKTDATNGNSLNIELVWGSF